MFTFGMYILVISGFYKGCKGTVVDFIDITPKKYVVNLTCDLEDGYTRFINGKHFLGTELKRIRFEK
jgi:hypothetical protein